MTPPRSDAGHVRMSDAELEAILARAAEEGARRAPSSAARASIASRSCSDRRTAPAS